MRRVRSASDLLNFLSVVMVTAPDKFVQFDFLASEDQMDLQKAFDELRCGLDFLRGTEMAVLAELGCILDHSLQAYESGDSVRGAHLLHDFEELAFPNAA